MINLANTDSGVEREESKNEGKSKMEGRKLFGEEMAGGEKGRMSHLLEREPGRTVEVRGWHVLPG